MSIGIVVINAHHSDAFLEAVSQSRSGDQS
jgi:hypothetical protein